MLKPDTSFIGKVHAWFDHDHHAWFEFQFVVRHNARLLVLRHAHAVARVMRVERVAGCAHEVAHLLIDFARYCTRAHQRNREVERLGHRLVQRDLARAGCTSVVRRAAIAPVAVQSSAEIDDERVARYDPLVEWSAADVRSPPDRAVVTHWHAPLRRPEDRRLHGAPHIELAIAGTHGSLSSSLANIGKRKACA